MADQDLPQLPPNLQRVRPTLELVVVALLWSAAILAVLGVLAVAIFPDQLGGFGRVAETVGLLVAIGATAASARLTTLRHMRASRSGGRAYDQLRHQRGLRVSSMLLQLLEIFAAIVVAIRLGDAIGLVQVEFEPAVV